ncbi:hypothetical protein AAMO2058_000535100 [Amorphochlora amoebiformis]
MPSGVPKTYELTQILGTQVLDEPEDNREKAELRITADSRVFELRVGRNHIGRLETKDSSDNQIVLLNRSVSSSHAVLTLKEDFSAFIEDMGSTNGTFVGNHASLYHKNERLAPKKQHALKDGIFICFGNVIAQLALPETPKVINTPAQRTPVLETQMGESPDIKSPELSLRKSAEMISPGKGEDSNLYASDSDLLGTESKRAESKTSSELPEEGEGDLLASTQLHERKFKTESDNNSSAAAAQKTPTIEAFKHQADSEIEIPQTILYGENNEEEAKDLGQVDLTMSGTQLYEGKSKADEKIPDASLLAPTQIYGSKPLIEGDRKINKPEEETQEGTQHDSTQDGLKNALPQTMDEDIAATQLYRKSKASSDEKQEVEDCVDETEDSGGEHDDAGRPSNQSYSSQQRQSSPTSTENPTMESTLQATLEYKPPESDSLPKTVPHPTVKNTVFLSHAKTLNSQSLAPTQPYSRDEEPDSSVSPAISADQIATSEPKSPEMSFATIDDLEPEPRENIGRGPMSNEEDPSKSNALATGGHAKTAEGNNDEETQSQAEAVVLKQPSLVSTTPEPKPPAGPGPSKGSVRSQELSSKTAELKEQSVRSGLNTERKSSLDTKSIPRRSSRKRAAKDDVPKSGDSLVEARRSCLEVSKSRAKLAEDSVRASTKPRRRKSRSKIPNPEESLPPQLPDASESFSKRSTSRSSSKGSSKLVKTKKCIPGRNSAEKSAPSEESASKFLTRRSSKRTRPAHAGQPKSKRMDIEPPSTSSMSDKRLKKRRTPCSVQERDQLAPPKSREDEEDSSLATPARKTPLRSSRRIAGKTSVNDSEKKPIKRPAPKITSGNTGRKRKRKAEPALDATKSQAETPVVDQPKLRRKRMSPRDPSSLKKIRLLNRKEFLITGIDAEAMKIPSKIRDLEGRAKNMRDQFDLKDITGCSHMITDKIRRTMKFLAGLSSVPFIVHFKYVLDSHKAGKWLEEAKYILHDPESEKKWGFKLSESLTRAAKSKFLEGRTFFQTRSTKPVFDQMKTIIACAGGKLLKSAPRYFKPNYHVISCEDDLDSPQVERLKALGYIIHSKELILTGVLRQELLLQDFVLGKPSDSEGESKKTPPPRTRKTPRRRRSTRGSRRK